MENLQKPAELTLSGHPINSLTDLRTYFNMEEVSRYFDDGSLVEWLTANYYTFVVSAVKDLARHASSQSGDFRRSLCQALGVDYYSKGMTEEERSRSDVLRKRILEYLPEEKIPQDFENVALNQSDLAMLLNRGAQRIYLCHGYFSIPLKKPHILYIGLDDPKLEEAYTEEQYKKAGITVQGIKLPTQVDPATAERAREAALENGYDAFPETHSPLANIIHKQIKGWHYHRFYRLPFCTKDYSPDFSTRSACESALKQFIEDSYATAHAFLDPGSDTSIVRETASVYQEILDNCFAPIMKQLQRYCQSSGKTPYFENLERLLNGSHARLLERFRGEIIGNRDYYHLYNLEYFIDRVDIEEHDYRFEEGILRILETLLTDSLMYSFQGINDSVHEMENDLNRLADSFFTFAWNEYSRLRDEVENTIEIIGSGLPEFLDGEDIIGYLMRMEKAE